MPTAALADLTMHYETDGTGDPLILIPYLGADHACYAFQLPDYAKEFTCVTVDPRGAGTTEAPAGPFSTEQLADDLAALAAHLGISRAHVAGVSLGAATAMWLAAKHPQLVASVSLHSGWTATDAFQQAVVRSWRSTVASGGSVADAVINNLFPWCFTPETYAKRPEFIAGLADFVRSRPPQSVENFLAQSDAVLTHDATTRLADIGARTQITYGRWDLITSTRFLAELTAAIPHAQSHVFEDCSHVALHENPSAFNEVTLAFLTAQRL